MVGGSPKVVHTLGGGLAKGVLGVYSVHGGGWVKNGQKSAYVICTHSLKGSLICLFPLHTNDLS